MTLKAACVAAALGVFFFGVQGCAGPADDPTPVAQSRDALESIDLMEEISGDQGGCSNEQIRGCLAACGGPVNSCRGSTIDAVCSCRGGGRIIIH